jgi:excinuclease ABC subunit C
MARKIRDQLQSLEALNERQLVEKNKEYDQDAINYIIVEGGVKLAVFNISHGVLLGKNEYEFAYKEGFLEEFISQYYSEEKIPKEILLPEEVTSSMQDYLSDIKGSRVRILVPQRGESLLLLNLVKKNLEKTFMEKDLILSDLKDAIGLETLPVVIECFDISHLSGTDTVGSMVRFKDAIPDKSNYRRFRIRTVEGIDDFASIAEIVRRRYSRLKDEGSMLPDLVVIDGGPGQLSAASKTLVDLGLKIPIISLAKRLEEIYFPASGLPITLDRKSRALQLLQRIRDESHRFAVSYHKVLRKKRTLR